MATIGLLAALLPALATVTAPSATAQTDPQTGCPTGDASSFTLHVGNFIPTPPGRDPTTPSGHQEPIPIDGFRYIVNLNNVGNPSDPDLFQHPGLHPMASNSPVCAHGEVPSGDTTTISLPPGRYLITVQAATGLENVSTTHKMWGGYVDLPADAGSTVNVDMIPFPLPLGKVIAHVFNDHNPVNGAPDVPEVAGTPTQEVGLEGFNIQVHDFTDEIVTADWWGNPICTQYAKDANGNIVMDAEGRPAEIVQEGGECLTDPDGNAVVENLAPGKYEVYAIPPDGTEWTQTTTFEGGFPVSTRVTENDDGTGAIREALVGTLTQPTAYWFGFVDPLEFGDPGNPAGTATIQACARTWVGFPPFDRPTINPNEPIDNGWVALSNLGLEDAAQVYAAPLGDSADCPGGVIDIPNVPTGNYQIFIWDEQLNYIFRQFRVDVPTDGATVELPDEDPSTPIHDVGVFRFFGWLSGHVYNDNGIAADGTPLPDGTAENGIRDCHGVGSPGFDPNVNCERGLGNTDLDIRARDGSVTQDAFTDPDGYYEFPQALAPLGKFEIGEVGFGRFQTTGPSLHSEYTQYDPDDAGAGVPVLQDQGGGLLTNTLIGEGHRSTVDWGKRPWGPDEVGPIVGITLYDTTRNELDARFSAAESYLPGIPDIPVDLYTLGDDGEPNTPDDVLVNQYRGVGGVGTDHWQPPPSAGEPPCDVLDANGDPVTPPPRFPVGERCLEVPMVGNEVKDGAFDAGYLFDAACPDASPYDPATGACADGSDPSPDNFTARDYVVSVEGHLPEAYEVTKEEDVNVYEGDRFVPQIPPVPCVGNMHHVPPQDELPFETPFADTDMPLCDKKLVTAQKGRNENADFFIFTKAPIPGRIFGLVSDDINVDTDKTSLFYGEPRALPNIPVGIRDYSYRLITTVNTDEHGFYEALLPSTQTFNAPIPQGVAPGTYIFVINDPGTPENPNPNFNPNYLTEPLAFEVWPGKMTKLDTPLDPISGVACSAYNGPEFFAADKVVVPRGGSATARTVTIQGINFGAARVNTDLPPTDPEREGFVTLINATTGQRFELRSDAYYTAWTEPTNPPGPAEITLQIPTVVNGVNLAPGPYELLVTAPKPTQDPNLPLPPSHALTTPTGITLHYTGSFGGTSYNPPIRYVDGLNPAASDGNPGTEAAPYLTIQHAVDASGAGTLILVKPATYSENVIMYKRVKLQGYGPGGVNGAKVTPDPPDDPRRHVVGSAINGKFWNYDPAVKLAWQQKLASVTSQVTLPGGAAVPGGADITVLGSSSNNGNPSFFGPAATQRPPAQRAQIDGFTIELARADGGGGVFANGYARSLQVSNNFVEGNYGLFGGGVVLGMPYRGADGNASNHNQHATISYNRILGNGGTNTAGGVGLYNGADNYGFTNNDVCSNFAAEYGGGLSHFGSSPSGLIRQNKFYFNSASPLGAEGGGVTVAGQLPLAGGPLTSSGTVDIIRNRFAFNQAGDDGGGIRVLDALRARINIRNNLIQNNNSGDLGGGIALDDSSNVWIENNTISRNTSTCSTTGCDGLPHAAGLVSEPHTNEFLTGPGGLGCTGPPGAEVCPAGVSKFSNPALLNNLFLANEAFTTDFTVLPGGDPLTSQGFIDMEVFGTPGTFSPRFSGLSVAYPSAATMHATNVVLTAPGESQPLITIPETAFDVGFNTGTGEFVINIIGAGGAGAEPQPPGHDGVPGDYHLCGPPTISADGTLTCTSEEVVDKGARLTGLPAATVIPRPVIPVIMAPLDDFDGEARPFDFPSVANRCPIVPLLPDGCPAGAFDVGADELRSVPGPPPVPFPGQ